MLFIFIFLLLQSNNSISVSPTCFLFPQFDIILMIKLYPSGTLLSVFSFISFIVKRPSMNLFLIQSILVYFVIFVLIVLFDLIVDNEEPFALLTL